MRNSPTSSWRSAATPTRRRPTTSSRTGCPTCRAERSPRSRSGSRARRAAKAKIIFVDPRRTPTVAICETVAGKDNVLHLDIEPGTDIALFNGLFTYVVDQGWHDKDFIAAVHERLRRRRASQQALARRGEPDHRCSRREAQTSRRVGVQAEGRRASAAHDARLRERHHLGQRQLPDPVGAGRSGARDAQRRPPRNRRRAHGRTPGRLHAAALSGRQEDLHRPGDHPGTRADVHGWGAQSVPDDAQRRAAPRASSCVARPSSRRRSARCAAPRPQADGRHHLRRGEEQGWPVRRQHQPLSDRCSRDAAHLHAAGRAPGRDEPHLDERRAADAPVAKVHGPARGRRSRIA